MEVFLSQLTIGEFPESLENAGFLFTNGFLANLWNRPLYPNSPFKFGGMFHVYNALKVKPLAFGTEQFCLGLNSWPLRNDLFLE